MNYFVIALASVSVGVGCAVHGQVSDLAAPSRPAQLETAIPPAPGGTVHPGTAILDSMGIFAGEPAQPSAVKGNAQAASTAKPN
jgi:hypothetical protein